MKSLTILLILCMALCSAGCGPSYSEREKQAKQKAAPVTYDMAAQDDSLREVNLQRAREEKERALAEAAESKRLADSTWKAEWEATRPALMKRIRSKEDKFESTTWYYPKAAPSYSDKKAIYLYLGSKGDQTWLRLQCRFAGDNWIFAKEMTLNIDGRKSALNPDDDGWERDNGSGRVWEYFDKQPTFSDVSIVLMVADSKETVIRFTGDKHYSDYTVTKADKQGIKDILALYKGLGGDLSDIPAY